MSNYANLIRIEKTRIIFSGRITRNIGKCNINYKGLINKIKYYSDFSPINFNTIPMPNNIIKNYFPT